MHTLTLNSGAELNLGSPATQDNTLTVTEMTVNDAASINGDLVIGGGIVTFTDAVVLTMGGSVTIGSEGSVTIIIDAEQIAQLEEGKYVNLFVDVTAVTLNTKNIVLTDSNGQSLMHDYKIETRGQINGKNTIYAMVAPEPATATLSLLALAALATRRKRK